MSPSSDSLRPINSTLCPNSVLTSKEAKARVDQYIVHYMTTDRRYERLDALFSEPGLPLLNRERALKRRLDALKDRGPTITHIKVRKS